MPRFISLALTLPIPHVIGLHDGNYLQNGFIVKYAHYPVVVVEFESYHTVRLPRNCFIYEHSRSESWHNCMSRYSGHRHVNFPSRGDVNDYDSSPSYDITAERLCSSQCSKFDCTSTGYVPSQIKTAKQRLPDQYYDLLQVEYSFQTLILYKLQMSFSVYILTVISLFGLSFDVSALAIVNLITASFVNTVSKFFKSSAIALILLAFIGQIVQISMIYYSYEVSTEVYIGSPKYLKYPVLWLCNSNYESFLPFVDESAFATFNYYVTDTENSSHSLQQEKFYIQNMDQMQRCVRMNVKKQYYLKTDSVLFSIFANREISTTSNFMLVPHRKLYVQNLPSFTYPNIMTYDIKNVSRLPAPYPSRCVNHNKQECEMNCILSIASEHNCTSFRYPHIQEALNYCSSTLDLDSSSDCHDRCVSKEECLSVQYEAKALDFTEQRLLTHLVLRARNITFCDFLPPETEITITEVASMTITSFVIYISGLLGLWYGANFTTLKQLAVNMLKHQHTRVAISIILASMTLCHSVIETTNYFKYATATLTTYETNDYILGPKLCLRHINLTRASDNYSAIDLNKLYSDPIIDRMITLNVKRQFMYYDMGNISKLNWYDTIDYYGKTYCLNPVVHVLNSRELALTYPARHLFMLRDNSSESIYASFRISSPFPGSGFEDPPRNLKLGAGRQWMYDTLHLKLLPAPYSTMCHSYAKSDESCLNKCLRETSYRIDKKLHQSAQTYTNDTRLFAAHRTHNTDLIEAECSNACKWPNCDVIVYRLSARRQLGDPRGLSYAEVSLGDYVTSSTFHPMLTLFDHLAILFGLLGLWLGFSVLGMARWADTYEIYKRLLRRKPTYVKRKVAWVTLQKNVPKRSRIVIPRDVSGGDERMLVHVVLKHTSIQ
ncbi:hypothetical protein HDE_06979 [Halotydeus destructor]|nr:hypothetical protein HDE_06979 [Halotydeus destructor]